MSLRFLLVLFIGLPFSLFGQNITLIIKDASTKAPLPYANIYFKNAGVGASTNTVGHASILLSKINAIDTAVISYIGYETKRILVDKNQNKSLTISLLPAQNILEEIIVKYVEPPKPKKIIRKAIKNTKDNYANQDVILKSLYRETVEENGKFIQLNEAITKTYYTSYPKKKLDRKIWKDWYYDDSYAFEFEGSRLFYPLLKDFNTKQDQQTIVASRHSEDWSSYGIENTLTDDPLLLFGFDKIKYQYDFLNPKLLRKYNFKHEPTEMINGEACYVISFYPKSTNRKFRLDQSKKSKRAIYIGRMYFTKDTYALVRFKYKLAVERDYGFFAKRMPLDYQVEVNYKKYNSFYAIDQIDFSETRPVGRDDNGSRIIHNVNRSIDVLDLQTEKVVPFLDSILFKSTRLSSIRHYKKNYNPNYWNTLQLPKHLKLSKKLVSDLEKSKSLTNQFDLFIKEEKRDIPVPVPAKDYFSFNYHNEKIVDSLHWMASSKHAQKLKIYLTAENKYAKNELIEDKPYQRKLFNELNDFYPPDSNRIVNPKIGTYFFGEDSLNNIIFYFQKDSIEKISILNITEYKDQYPDRFVDRLIHNQNKNCLLLTYNKTGSTGGFISILKDGASKESDHISNVYSVEWFSDSIFVYAKTNAIGRAGELWYRNANTGKESLLYTEEDQTFDIEVLKQDKHLFSTIQSKIENEIYQINSLNGFPVLKKILPRQSGINYKIKAADGIYALLNDENSFSSIKYADFKSPDNFSELIRADESEYYEDFIPIGGKLVVLSFENSIPILKYLKIGEKKWQKINLDLGIGWYSFHSKQPNLNQVEFSFDGPSQPRIRYRYDFNTKQLKTLSSLKIKEENLYRYTTTKRVWAKGKDGIKIPITLLKSKVSNKHQKSVILKVYGAYGANYTPSFNAQDALLLQEGYTIAYANVRGGGIMGPAWYKNGRRFKKKNSIDDYLACAKFLIQKGIADPNNLIGYGNSAGGLIVAQAINEAPGLFKTVILDHAYLDVVNTMMNDTLPLTIDEYKEWGNPNEKEVYDYILSYSPYQNIKPQKYPNVILFGGYQDYRTPIWQIAKYAAKLRANNLSDSVILLRTDMTGSHTGGKTGKEWIKDFAEMGSFLKY